MPFAIRPVAPGWFALGWSCRLRLYVLAWRTSSQGGAATRIPNCRMNHLVFQSATMTGGGDRLAYRGFEGARRRTLYQLRLEDKTNVVARRSLVSAAFRAIIEESGIVLKGGLLLLG